MATLTDQELFDHFYGALSLYIKNNGETVNKNNFKLVFNPALHTFPQIRNWLYGFSEPTIAQLKALALADIKADIVSDIDFNEIFNQVSSNFGVFLLIQHLKNDHSMTNAQVRTFIRQQYIRWKGLE